jgi:hypothetical protein
MRRLLCKCTLTQDSTAQFTSGVFVGWCPALFVEKEHVPRSMLSGKRCQQHVNSAIARANVLLLLLLRMTCAAVRGRVCVLPVARHSH